MTREALDRLLTTVSDEDLEQLRDAILREEGRRRAALDVTIEAPFPPLAHDADREVDVTRWSNLLTWLANDAGFPRATGKRGLSITITYSEGDPPDPQQASILLQQALVQSGLLGGRTSEWVDATTTLLRPGSANTVQIQLWEKPGND